MNGGQPYTRHTSLECLTDKTMKYVYVNYRVYTQIRMYMDGFIDAIIHSLYLIHVSCDVHSKFMVFWHLSFYILKKKVFPGF